MSEKYIRLVIISGLSGAGKSAALNSFEDNGFFCIDNLPPKLITKFIEIVAQPGSDIHNVALGIDIRNRDFLNDFLSVYADLLHQGVHAELLFMDARDEILVRRFSESRRPHPLAKDRSVLEGILEEREKISELKKHAHQIIDTSTISLVELKNLIRREHVKKEEGDPLRISLLSFGFKYGLPYGLDLLFDVRFLKNPYFQSGLRMLSGNDASVMKFVVALPETDAFMEKLIDFLDFMIPLYEAGGKSYLTIGIGCTGGRHRSVAIVNLLRELLQQRGRGNTLSFFHRDIKHDPIG